MPFTQNNAPQKKQKNHHLFLFGFYILYCSNYWGVARAHDSTHPKPRLTERNQLHSTPFPTSLVTSAT
jgi:hypothetical protein